MRLKALLFLFLSTPLFAQDSITVFFRYKAKPNAVRAFLPGAFYGSGNPSNWGPNVNGRIATDAISLMTFDQNNGYWFKSMRLRVGGGDASLNGQPAYQYKMHEQYNSDGSQWQWFTDPANPNSVPPDNNSLLRVANPMISQIEPNNIGGRSTNSAIVPVIASVSSLDNDRIDTAQSKVFFNDALLTSFGTYYDRSRQLLSIPSLAALGVNIQSGLNEIKIVAVTQSGATRVDSANFQQLQTPPIVNQPVPAGTKDGINYNSSTSVTLSLLAPNKRFVYVIGDFNNWELRPEYFMKRDSLKADSVRWWLTIDGLTAGQEYAFQYLVDGELRLADPYTEKTLDPFDDRFIPSNTYPNLKPYPSGQTSFQTSIIQTTPSTYAWAVTNFQPPDKRDLVIYELHIRDFFGNPNRNFQTLIDTLSYFQKLGVNAIELMPINEFEGNSSWGYNPSFYFAPDKYYGTKQNLKRLIDSCHARGIAVIIDMVLNHSFGQSPMVRQYATGDYGPPTDDNLWFNRIERHPFNVGYDMNHESKYTKDFVKRVNNFWLTEYKVDGFRFDLSKGFTQVNSGSNVGFWNQYDASRIAIWKRIFTDMQLTSPTSYCILEHLSDNPEETELANFGMMLWGKMVSPYNEATMGYHANGISNLSGGYYLNRGWAQNNLVTIIEDHDEERLMYKNLSFGNSSGAYNIRDTATALDRMKLAGAFFFTIPGPKMFWQFGEFGYHINIDFNGRTGEKPVGWNILNANPNLRLAREKLMKTWAALIKLKTQNIAFREGSLAMDVGGAVKRLNISHTSMNVTVIGNFDVVQQTANPNFQSPGVWYNYFEGDSITVTNTTQGIALRPGEFRIYTTRRLAPPEQGLLNASESAAPSRPTRFALEQNFPNPFNPSTVINYELAQASMVKLEVFDVLGRSVETIVNERKPAGNYSARFDGRNLSSGVYFYRLATEKFTATKKMLLVK
jgi:1,4-alpha-glucan branching enzyme